MNNTGYKIATYIKVERKSVGQVTEKSYGIGRYIGGRFAVLDAGVLAGLTEAEYELSVSDTLNYVLSEEGVDNLEMSGNSRIYDTSSCPLPLLIDVIGVVCEVTLQRTLAITFTAVYAVASNIQISISAGSEVVECILLKGTQRVSVVLPDSFAGNTGVLKAMVQEIGGDTDETYRYKIQDSVAIPLLVSSLKDNRLTPQFRMNEDSIDLFMLPDYTITSDLVIRFSMMRDGVEVNFDISEKKGNAIHRPTEVPPAFYGAEAGVKIFSVGGVSGILEDEKYRYLVDGVLKMPDLVVREENMIDVDVFCEPGAVRYRARSARAVASEVVVDFTNTDIDDQFFVLKKLTLNTGLDAVTGKAGSNQYGKYFTVFIYSVGGRPGVVSDDRYRYVATSRVVRIPDPAELTDNTLAYDFVMTDGKVKLVVNLPYPSAHDLIFSFKNMSGEIDGILRAGETSKEWDVPVSMYGRTTWPIMEELGGSYPGTGSYKDFLWDEKYRYGINGEKKTVPLPPRKDNFIRVEFLEVGGVSTLRYSADHAVASQIFVRATDAASGMYSTGNFYAGTSVAYDSMNTDYNRMLLGKTLDVSIYRVFSGDNNQSSDLVYDYKLATIRVTT